MDHAKKMSYVCVLCGFLLLSIVIDIYYNPVEKLDAAYEAEKLAWFGAGGTYGILSGDFYPAGEKSRYELSYTGVYGSSTIRHMAQWEREGLGSLPIWGDGQECLTKDQVDVIVDTIEGSLDITDPEIKEREIEDYKKLLSGGYNLSGIMNYTEFVEKIWLIQETYQDEYHVTIHIQTEWNSDIKNE